MKIINAPGHQDDLDPQVDRAGQLIAQRLLAQADSIDPHILQRLHAARLQAVEHHRQAYVLQVQVGLTTGSQTLAGQGSDQPSGWLRLSMIGMFLTLVLGLWMIDTIQSDNSTQDAADIDGVLLTDDLPPAAYLDSGFKNFLKLSYPSESN
jgi:hypothetical protein